MSETATNATILLDLLYPSMQTIHAKQFDALSRYATIRLTCGGIDWLPADGTIYAVQYTKPDGTKGMYDKLPDGKTAAVTADTETGSTILSVRFAPQMFTVPGKVRCSVAMLQTSGVKLQTFSFTVMVEESDVNGDTSEDYYKMATIDSLMDAIGDLSSLTTAKKDSVVAAINWLSSGAAMPVAKSYSDDGISYTATGGALPTVQAGSGETWRGKGRQIVFIPYAKNANTAPTLQLNGGSVIPIRQRAPRNQGSNDQSPGATLPVPAGALMRGVPYTLTFCGKYWLVDSQIATVPAPTATDAGKVLTVSEAGAAVWTAVANAEEVAV